MASVSWDAELAAVYDDVYAREADRRSSSRSPGSSPNLRAAVRPLSWPSP